MPGTRFLVSCCVLLFLAILSVRADSPTPIVLLHGINSQKSSLTSFKALLEKHVPGIYVRNEEIGNGKEDSWKDLHKQKEELCRDLRNDPNLKGKSINLFCVSQGGVTCRSYIELCNDPPVKTFISYDSPQAGVWGPKFFMETCMMIFNSTQDCKDMHVLFKEEVYSDWFQSFLSFASYWRDPRMLADFRKSNSLLARIDLEQGPHFNATEAAQARANMLGLQNLVLVHSTHETVLAPKESSLWATYAPGETQRIVPLFETELYKSDRIGLRTLHDSGRLHFLSKPMRHADTHTPEFVQFFLSKLLPYVRA